jgi:hypothetical protein
MKFNIFSVLFLKIKRLFYQIKKKTYRTKNAPSYVYRLLREMYVMEDKDEY